MQLLWFTLAAFGLTQILVYGKIFDKYRPTKEDYKGWGEIFHCPMCMGFWVGVFLFGINNWTELFTFDYTLVNAFVLGWLSSGTCYLFGVLVNDFGFKVTYKNEGDCHVD